MMVSSIPYLSICIKPYHNAEGQHNDARMNVALIMTAVKHGATVANYCEVTKLNKDTSGKINGARVKDNLTGEEWNVRAKVSRQHYKCRN